MNGASPVDLAMGPFLAICLFCVLLGALMVGAFWWICDRQEKLKTLATKQIYNAEANIQQEWNRLGTEKARLERKDIDLYLRERKLEKAEAEVQSLRRKVESAYEINKSVIMRGRNHDYATPGRQDDTLESCEERDTGTSGRGYM